MDLQSLKQIRNLFLRTALVSVLLAWLLAALTIGLWDTWTGLMSGLFRTQPVEFGALMGNWFALIKFYIIFVLLAPALALHWEAKRREKQS
jgi:hypothetical protein